MKQFNVLRHLPLLLILAGIVLIISSFVTDLLGIGGQSGFGARQLMLALSGSSVLLVGIIRLVPDKHRPIFEWVWMGIIAIGVAAASDLILETGFSKIGLRQLFMMPFIFSLLAIKTSPKSDGQTLQVWLQDLIKDKQSILVFFTISVQLALMMVLVNQYDLENRAFSQNIFPFVFYGFLFHYLLPVQNRLPFFLLLSITAILGIFNLENGIWLITSGIALIGICHLPISFLARAVILIAAGVILALLRANFLPNSWSGAIWPILGSMFMFRLVVYMYEVKHSKDHFNPVRSLSYFFMLPNLVFPLFPVVDYGTFRRTYFDVERNEIYQKGLDWILRGVIQLILYRFVSYYLVISPQEVVDINDLIQYILSTFLLYLRVSGQFHLIVGILHLFGFNLPETNNRYFLASSFTDFWRRINIYWKDFMLKVVYYPGYFQLRKLGATPALILTTLLVFFVTWLLHAYQWFWLRGSFLLSVTDTLFWAILAILVVANSLYEAKHGKKRTLSKPVWTWNNFFFQTLRTAGTFITVALLWTLWSSASLSEFLSLWSVEVWDAKSTSGLLSILLLVGLVSGGKYRIGSNWRKKWALNLRLSSFTRSTTITGSTILFLLLIGSPWIHGQIPCGLCQEVIRDLKVSRLNDRDAALLQRGYYEDLIGVNRFNSQLWEVYMNRPGDAGGLENEFSQPTGDFLKQALQPLLATVLYDNIPFRTNRWGMRDQDYEKIPPPNTYRIAILGASYVMGWGVGDDETFESIVETRLNNEPKMDPETKFELLNFGDSDYSAFQQLMILETKVFDFQPNAVIYTAHQYDEEVNISHLIERFLAGVTIPYDYLLSTLREAEVVDQNISTDLAIKRLNPYGSKMLLWTYQQIVENCRKRGALPIWIMIPAPEQKIPEEKIASLVQLAEEAGFTVLNLSDAYEGQDVQSLWLDEWDHHPNAKGHLLIADHLYQALIEKPEIFLGINP
jgi:D-alanyl-lipoteichoic acid acyltransferase DltB (MBOAT superfamily)